MPRWGFGVLFAFSTLLEWAGIAVKHCSAACDAFFSYTLVFAGFPWGFQVVTIQWVPNELANLVLLTVVSMATWLVLWRILPRKIGLAPFLLGYVVWMGLSILGFCLPYLIPALRG